MRVSTCETPHYLVLILVINFVASNAKVWRYEVCCTSTQQILTRLKFVFFFFYLTFSFTLSTNLFKQVCVPKAT